MQRELRFCIRPAKFRDAENKSCSHREEFWKLCLTASHSLLAPVVLLDMSLRLLADELYFTRPVRRAVRLEYIVKPDRGLAVIVRMLP